MKIIFAFLALFIIHTSAAQHVIYLTDESKIPGKIIEITSSKIKYKTPTDISGPTHTHSLDNVAFAFNEAGSFLIFSKDNNLLKNEKDDFINSSKRVRSFDLVVDTAGHLSPVTITNETSSEIFCMNKGKKLIIPTITLSFVLRKNGTHQIFSSVLKTYKILSLNKDKVNLVAQEQPVKLSDKTPDKVAPLILTSKEQNDFRQKAQGQIESFKQYLNAVTAAGSSGDRKAAANATNLACNLFVSDTSKVQVSSKIKNTTDIQKIRDYLTRLRLRSSQFDKIDIDYVNVSWASQFRLGTDGYFHGNISFVQKFQGYSDGKMVYQDQTKKNVEIIVKSYQKEKDGKSESSYQVFLGDIGVSER